MGHTAFGLTDHECLSGHVKAERIYEKVREQYPNFKLIRGNEIYLVRNGLNAQNFIGGQDRYFHFLIVCRDAIGHQQLREISTRAWLRSYMARGMRRVPTYYQDLIDVIGEDRGHLVAATACLGGVLPTQLLRYRDSGDESLLQKIYIWINQIDEIFGHGNFYFEMQPSNNKDQIYVNKKLLELSRELSIPYIITTDSHYLRREDRSIHKSYLNSQNGDREVDDFYATTYMMGTDEIESFFPYLSTDELEEAYRNIQAIADSCENYSIQKPLKIPELMWRPVESFEDEYAEWFEKMPMLEQFSTSEDDADRYLVNAVIYGVKQHPDLQNEQAYKDLNENLETTWTSSRVNKASWASYFLNLQNIIDECWKSGTIVGPSRGSGGGFLLLYCLDIIQMNRLREPTQMFPWRFLNPVRVSPLDVDIDIMGTNRSATLKHLRDVYGDDHVTNVATFRTEKSRSSILTAARGLGIDVDIAQYIANMIPSDRGIQRSLDQCMYGDEGNGWEPIKSFVFEMTENYPELWEVAHNIEGLVSGLNVHAGGVIFVDEPFTNSTALMRAPDGTICTAFELHDSEAVSQRKVKAHKYLTVYQQRYIGSLAT